MRADTSKAIDILLILFIATPLFPLVSEVIVFFATPIGAETTTVFSPPFDCQQIAMLYNLIQLCEDQTH